MDLKQLIDGNVGKRMAAFAWGAWLIGQATEPRMQILTAALTAVYMVCQTVSDFLENQK